LNYISKSPFNGTKKSPCNHHSRVKLFALYLMNEATLVVDIHSLFFSVIPLSIYCKCTAFIFCPNLVIHSQKIQLHFRLHTNAVQAKWPLSFGWGELQPSFVSEPFRDRLCGRKSPDAAFHAVLAPEYLMNWEEFGKILFGVLAEDKLFIVSAHLLTDQNSCILVESEWIVMPVPLHVRLFFQCFSNLSLVTQLALLALPRF